MTSLLNVSKEEIIEIIASYSESTSQIPNAHVIKMDRPKMKRNFLKIVEELQIDD